MQTKRSGQRRAPLTSERVLQAAIILADTGGIELLTMRKLAQALGVKAMSLYNHVADKDAILDGIVDLVLDEIALPDIADEWENSVRSAAISAHEVLLRHPWACNLLMSRFRPARMRYMNWLLWQLREAGFSPEITYRAYHAVDSHILGFTMWQLGHSVNAEDLGDSAATFLREFPLDDLPDLAEHVRQHLTEPRYGEGEFEFGLDLILDGLKRISAGAQS